MTFRTKSIYDPKSRVDGLRILVSRHYSRGMKRDRLDLWIREASPKTDLLKAYKQGSISWREFQKRFKLQLRTADESKAAIQKLLELSRIQAITLLCYEKEGEKCHRQIVKTKLESLVEHQKEGRTRKG